MDKRILCGVDASPDSVSAAAVASSLVRRLESRAVLMHVATDRGRSAGLRSIDRARERGRLRALVESQGFPDGTGTRLEPGDPAPTLARAAADEGAELMVVGMGGRPKTRLGGVSAALVEHTPCPLVLVPARIAASAGETVVGSIVCTVYASQRETEVLGLGRDLAERLGADPYSVRVSRPPTHHPATAMLGLAEELCADLIVAGCGPELARVLAANAHCPVVFPSRGTWSFAPPWRRVA